MKKIVISIFVPFMISMLAIGSYLITKNVLPNKNKPTQLIIYPVKTDHIYEPTIISCIEATSYETLYNWKDITYPIILTLIAEDTKKTMTINNRSQLPMESVLVECPKSEYSKNCKCYFIRYSDEFNK